MVRLSTQQTSHEEWSQQNQLADNSVADSEATEADSFVSFEDSLEIPPLSALPEANQAETANLPTVLENDESDESDDDIVGCRRRPVTAKIEEESAPNQPHEVKENEAPLEGQSPIDLDLEDSSDDDPTDDDFINDDSSDDDDFVLRKKQDGIKKLVPPVKTTKPSSIRSNRDFNNDEMSFSSFRTPRRPRVSLGASIFDDDDEADRKISWRANRESDLFSNSILNESSETEFKTPGKPRISSTSFIAPVGPKTATKGRLSVTSTPAQSRSVSYAMDDEIRMISKNMGDLMMGDEDAQLEYNPNKFRTPKIIKTPKITSKIFDISDNEEQSDNDSVLLPTPGPKAQSIAPKKIADRLQKKEFDQQKQALAEAYLAEMVAKIHDGAMGRMTAKTGGIKVEWTRKGQTTAGWCHTKLHSTDGVENKDHHYSCTIYLEEKVTDSVERMKEVMAHEFAHACVAILEIDKRRVEGKGFKAHGPVFKEWAAKVGRAMGIATPTTCHSYSIDYKFEYECPSCKALYKAHTRKVEWTKTRGCRSCKLPLVQVKPVPRTTKKQMLDDGTVEVVPRTPNAFQVYKKEMYSQIKTEMGPGTPFAEVNREVSRRWKLEKERQATTTPAAPTAQQDDATGSKRLLKELIAARDAPAEKPQLMKENDPAAILDVFDKLTI